MDLSSGYIKGTANNNMESSETRSATSIRAGRYVTQPTGYKAFIAANDLVARMVESGILRAFSRQARNQRFIYQNYIELFHDTKLGAST